MSTAGEDFTKRGFAKTFVLPALLVFLVPILALLFFLHAQSRFDKEARSAILYQIKSDPKMSEEERAAATEFFTKVPVSRLVAHEEFAGIVNDDARRHYATFRWMIRLSVLSLAAGAAVFVLAGICVWLSLRSQLAQYLSLMAGWHVLRIYGALQTIVLGILVVALSYWVTALWMNVYVPKLIFIAGIASVCAVFAIVVAIFRKPKHDFVVEGTVIHKDDAKPLWNELNAICAKVGAEPPDQVIAGIDDNFFVTEHPVTVDGTQYRGKTLFVSLALLKQLHSTEAAAVLAHEMAHFSGKDTLYSKKISPLLQRYAAYLEALHGGIAMPIFYFMLCFRALFELSLGKLSRQREFRADKIAAATTSPRDFAGALLRIAAYSKFRNSVQMDLFKQEKALEAANVSERIESGFPAYAVAFASDPAIGESETAHPFDSHPPMSQRLSALDIRYGVDEARALLATSGDGGWRDNIPNADELEGRQWQAFEERFRSYHEETLPYRYLPETPDEQAVVERSFPARAFEGKEGELTIDFEKAQHAPWADPILYSEITNCELGDGNVLRISFERSGKHSRPIKVAKFPKDQQQEILQVFQKYYSRYLAAVEYKKETNEEAERQETQAAS